MTRSIGLVFNETNEKIAGYLELAYNEEKDPKVLAFYQEFLKLVGGFKKTGKTVYRKDFEEKDFFKASTRFLEEVKPEIDALARKMEVEHLFIEPDKFNKLHSRIMSLRSKPSSDEEIASSVVNGDQENTNGMTYPLNQILYGPPGTGKTYHTINKTLAIIEGKSEADLAGEERINLKERFQEYIDEGQILFTTFHQSMSYEDFVEGIKPETVDRRVVYETKSGIFKALCQKASSNFENSKSGNQKKLPFEVSFEKLKEEWEEDTEMKFPLKTANYDYTILEFTNTSIRFKKASGGTGHTLSINTLKDLYYGKVINFKQGVGIYYPSILDKLKSYDSEESEGVQLKNYVLIIDEINRGNVSQIFGELITLIEEDKRLGEPEALEITLPYSKESFSVPSNLYIIGTMNTADRSVEALDTALRRRFSFKEMPPRYDLKQLAYEIFGFKIAEILKTINQRIEKLLDKDHMIGHSNFILKNETNKETKVRTVFYKKIVPQLQEYFFGDFGKIGLVLGEGFVQKQEDFKVIGFAKFGYEDAADFEEREIYEIIDHSEEEDMTPFEKAIYALMNK